jgi:hypothetical protein
MQRQPSENKTTCALSGALALLTFCTIFVAQAQNSAPSPQTGRPDVAHRDTTLPRGQKLILKDGTFQMVSEYKVEGDRVSYYSLDTHQWEEMPSSLIDWDATKKEAAQEAKQDTALVNAVDAREKAEKVEVLSVDASIEPAPGIFLPPDVGLFAFDGKTIVTVNQAEMKSSLSKGRMLAEVLVPVPIVPTRHTISILGTRAKLRMTNGQPEFYMRTADGTEPEIDLIRARVKGNERQVENVDELMGEMAENRKAIALQRWQMATNVYRYTIAKRLEPGEYVLAETVPNDQVSIYLWDFGIDVAK